MNLTRRDVGLGALACIAAPAHLRAQNNPVADPVAGLVAQVDPVRLRETVAGLSSAFPTRWTEHAAFPAVEEWVARAFHRINAAPVARQPFAMPSGLVRHNIVAGDPMDPRGVILLGAHFDSISERPATLAPGANDNATGIAAMLEAHRILSAAILRLGVVSVAFAGAEQDLAGSTACAAIAAEEGWPIALMLNLDMLGARPRDPGAPMIIEYDQGNAVAGNDRLAAAFASEARAMAAAYTTLATSHTDIWSSDYMPFEARGYNCIGLYDGGVEDGHYHRSTDIVEHVDFGRLEQATRLVVATVASIARAA